MSANYYAVNPHSNISIMEERSERCMSSRASTSSSQPVNDPNSGSKYAFTTAVCFAYFAFGMLDNVRAPTLLDVAENTDSTFTDVSYGLLILAGSYCLASLNWSCLFFLINRQLGFIACLLIAGTMTLLVPFMHNIENYWITQGFLGFAFAGIDVAANAWMMEMWADKSNPFMQSMYFCYAIGQTIAPLTAAPFLSTRLQDHPHLITGSYLAENITIHVNDSFILVPYSFASLTAFAAAVTLACLYFSKSRYIERSKAKKMQDQQAAEVAMNMKTGNISTITVGGDRRTRAAVIGNYRRSVIPVISGNRVSTLSCMPGLRKSYLTSISESKRSAYMDMNQNVIEAEPDSDTSVNHRNLCYKSCITVIGCFLLCSYSTIDLNSFLFLPEYVVNGDLQVTRETAAIMLSLMSAMYAASRGLGIVIATEYSSRTMLMINIPLIGMGNLLILLLGQSSGLAVWMGILLMGTGFGSTFPAACSFLEERVTVTNAITGCFMFSAKICSILLIFVMGPLVESHPNAFPIANMIAFASCSVFLAALLASDYCRPVSAQEEQREEETRLEPRIIQSRYSRDVTFTKM